MNEPENERFIFAALVTCVLLSAVNQVLLASATSAVAMILPGVMVLAGVAGAIYISPVHGGHARDFRFATMLFSAVVAVANLYLLCVLDEIVLSIAPSIVLIGAFCGTLYVAAVTIASSWTKP